VLKSVIFRAKSAALLHQAFTLEQLRVKGARLVVIQLGFLGLWPIAKAALLDFL